MSLGGSDCTPCLLRNKVKLKVEFYAIKLIPFKHNGAKGSGVLYSQLVGEQNESETRMLKTSSRSSGE